jgi:hypothetical protein
MLPFQFPGKVPGRHRRPWLKYWQLELEVAEVGTMVLLEEVEAVEEP